MPPPSSRMTKQPERFGRFFPGKALAEEVSSEEEDSDEDQPPAPAKAPPPKATSFPSAQKLPVGAAKAKAAAVSQNFAQKPDDDDLEGFVTASESSDNEESGDESQDSGEESSSEEEEDSSSDDEPKKPMLAPKFIPKAKRAQMQAASTASAEQQEAEEELRRAEKTNALLQAQLERDAAARAAGRRAWDDDNEVAPEDEVDDTDGLDAEGERAEWKLRELKRVQRDRQALIAKEQEREEIERRRNMSAEEREREDREFLEQQQEEKEGKGKMAFMQKYYHKGAYFQDGDAEEDEEVKRVLNRDLAGVRFEDETADKSVLPEYMRIRDMTRLGKKGRTRYKDLKSEDTGSWARAGDIRKDYSGLDERFRPDDRHGEGRDRTGANAAPVGERRRRDDDDGTRDREDKRVRYD